MIHAPGPSCGNCGKTVASPDVTCPHCGVLLAAYQPPAGAATGDAFATKPVDATPPPAPATPVTPEPPASPANTAPIDPAASLTTSSPIRADAPIGSDRIADELREMAKDKSGFAAQVEAELKEAKVVFDEDCGSRIETAPSVPDVVVSPASETRKAATQTPASTSKPAPVRVVRASEQEQEQEQAKPVPTLDPNRKLNPPKPARAQTMLNPEWVPSSTAPEVRERSGETAKKATGKNVLPIAFVFIVMATVVFRSPGAILFLVVALGLGIFFIRLLISASKSTSRTTTRMPYEKPDRRNKR
jgi:hypothetical protein